VGLSEKSARSRILFGSIAERISQQATGNVAIIRGADDETPSDTSTDSLVRPAED